jgi:hypothetical protein
VGGALLSYVFSKSASLQKACRKHAEKLAESLKSLIFKDFLHFILHILLMQKCIEKNEVLTAKIMPTGGAGRRGWWGGFFCICRKCRKKLLKCLIFNGLLYSAILSASFLQCLKPLIFNDFLTSSKCLFFNAFLHLCGAGWWVKGRVLSKVDKQGVGWWVVLCYSMFLANGQVCLMLA